MGNLWKNYYYFFLPFLRGAIQQPCQSRLPLSPRLLPLQSLNRLSRRQSLRFLLLHNRANIRGQVNLLAHRPALDLLNNTDGHPDLPLAAVQAVRTIRKAAGLFHRYTSLASNVFFKRNTGRLISYFVTISMVIV
jgi:hypothetical protein